MRSPLGGKRFPLTKPVLFLAILPGTFWNTKVENALQVDAAGARGVAAYRKAARHPLSWLLPDFIEIKRALSVQAHVKALEGHRDFDRVAFADLPVSREL